MSKGRKAEPGTYEAREYIVTKEFDKWLNASNVSQDCRNRLKKAIFFGLGVKSLKTQAEEKQAKIRELREELTELERK